MKNITAAMLGATCALVLTATAASAEIACNREGDCWHVKETKYYNAEHGVIIHPDNWRWADNDRAKFRFREHEGRGYWREGRWIEIR